ncbi:CBN-CLEC-50 protein [Aphelenchoides avenae]|nr:CBN-CLEC-50 protein [Aphelenchus avenae]
MDAGNEPPSNDPTCNAQTAVPNCEYGWTYNSENGKCYKVLEQNSTWSIHEAKCNLLGAHLASILSASENTFVKGLASQGKDMPPCGGNSCPAAVWIGLYQDASSPLEFKWADQSIFLYRNWAPKRPVYGSFPVRTFASLYADPMIEVSKQQGTKGFSGKWDHYPPDGITHVRAGVCKRDY